MLHERRGAAPAVPLRIFRDSKVVPATGFLSGPRRTRRQRWHTGSGYRRYPATFIFRGHDCPACFAEMGRHFHVVKETVDNSITTDYTGARPHGNPDIKELGTHRFTRQWCDNRNVSMVTGG